MKRYFYIGAAFLILGNCLLFGQGEGTITISDPPIGSGSGVTVIPVSDGGIIVSDTTIDSDNSVSIVASAGIELDNVNIAGNPISIASPTAGIEINDSTLIGTTPSLMPINADASIVMTGSTLGVSMNQASDSAGGNPGWTLWTLTAGDQVSISTLTLLLIADGLPDFDQSASYSWDVITAPGNNLSLPDGNINLDLSQFYNSYNGVFSTYATPSDLFLTYTPAPEASTISLLAISVPSVLLLRRRLFRH